MKVVRWSQHGAPKRSERSVMFQNFKSKLSFLDIKAIMEIIFDEFVKH